MFQKISIPHPSEDSGFDSYCHFRTWAFETLALEMSNSVGVDTVLSVRPSSRWSSGGTLGCFPAFSTTEEKGPWGPFYQLWQMLAKGSHLLQILLKALWTFSGITQSGEMVTCKYICIQLTLFIIILITDL